MVAEGTGFNPTFENGGYWELYKNLERQFEDFLEYVPYLGRNEQVYSFKLLNIFLSIGGHIDSAFKEMARYSEFIDDPAIQKITQQALSKRGVFLSAVTAFNIKYGLHTKKVVFKCIPEMTVVQPFSSIQPEWWTSYNQIKHNVSTNIEKASLRNVRDALAGAFLLNIIHIPAYIRLIEYRIVTPSSGYGIFTIKEGWKDSFKKNFLDKGRGIGIIETPLFKYNYEMNNVH